MQHILLCVSSEVRENKNEDDTKRKGLSVGRMALQLRGYETKNGSKGARKKEKIHSKTTGPDSTLRACSLPCWISFTHLLHTHLIPIFHDRYFSLCALKLLMKEILQLSHAIFHSALLTLCRGYSIIPNFPTFHSLYI